MHKKVSITVLYVALMATASPVAAQTSGYVREAVRQAATGSTTTREAKGSVGIDAKATVSAREAGTGRATGKMMLSATATAEIRLKARATSTPEEVRARVMEKRAQIESVIAAKKLTITAEMFANIKTRIESAVTRINTALDRLAEASRVLRTRTEKLAASGTVTGTATIALLDEADARIATLRVSAADIGEDAQLAAASTTPARAWVDAQASFKIVIAEVHAIRKVLHDAIAELKNELRAEGTNRGVSAAVSTEGSATVDTSSSTTAAAATSTAAATTTTP